MAGLTGEADNEADATPPGGNILCCSPEFGLVLGAGAGGSSVAARIDEGGTMDETVSDAALACDRNREGPPAGDRWGAEQYYEEVSWCGCHMCGEQMGSQV